MKYGPTALDSLYVQSSFPAIQFVHMFAGLDGPSPISWERRRETRQPIMKCQSIPNSETRAGMVGGTYSVLCKKLGRITISPEVSSALVCD